MDANNEPNEKEDVPNQIDEEQQTLTPGEKVYLNDLVFEKILKHVTNVEDIVRMQRASRRFRIFADGSRTPIKTLSILRISTDKDLLEVKYNNKVRILKLPLHKLNRADFDKILKYIPEDDIKSIKRVIINGIQSGLKDSSRIPNMLEVNEDLGPFLDRFVDLKYLELSSLNFEDRHIGTAKNAQFIRRITTLTVLDCKINPRELWKLVGTNVKTFRLTESMMRDDYSSFSTIVSNIENVIIYIDDKHWEKDVLDYVWREIYAKYQIIPWHLMYEKKISFKGDQFVPIRYCKDLKHIQLIKLYREVDEDIILRTIAELPYLPQLEKLTFDGYFTRKEIAKLIFVLKKCKKLIAMELRQRLYTENLRDWFILLKNLPKNLRCVKLDRLNAEQYIAVLKETLSDSLLNLELRPRGSLHMKTLNMIFHEFKKLVYLRVYNINLSMEIIPLLAKSNISCIEFHTSRREKVNEFTKAMKKHYAFVEHSENLDHSNDWVLSKINRGNRLEHYLPLSALTSFNYRDDDDDDDDDDDAVQVIFP